MVLFGLVLFILVLFCGWFLGKLMDWKERRNIHPDYYTLPSRELPKQDVFSRQFGREMLKRDFQEQRGDRFAERVGDQYANKMESICKPIEDAENKKYQEQKRRNRRRG